MFQPDLQFFRSAREQTISAVSGLSQEQMDFSPRPGKWSVGEVVDHLLLSENLYRNDIAQLIELAKSGKKPVLTRSVKEMNFSPAFLPKSMLPILELPLTWMNVFVPARVRQFIVRNRSIRGQNPDAAAPRKGRPASELRNELVASFQRTVSLMESNANLDFRGMFLRHAMMGNNNVLQVLRILGLHEQRHNDQIREILRDPAFPQLAEAKRA